MWMSELRSGKMFSKSDSEKESSGRSKKPERYYKVRLPAHPLHGAKVERVSGMGKNIHCKLLEARGAYRVGDEVTLARYELEP